ncbi:MAG: BlaI/MecI/CopY family transcriptional regulator [Acidobacteriia bacterium]|nr:BlaI/MecI/CopY family transcriptional regulator [Terriglobia bacterium]
MKERPKGTFGERELDVLQALWRLGSATVTEVQEELHEKGHELAYTTVQTILNRLEGKGRVARDSSDRAHRYQPLFQEPAAVTGAIQRLADRFFRGSVEDLATHLVERHLTQKQLQRIRAMVEKNRKEPQK